MTVPGCANPLLMYGDAGGYQIERSIRFNSSDSGFLSRTPASAGNRKTWSLSWWQKLVDFPNSVTGTTERHIFFTGSSTVQASSTYFRVVLVGDNTISIDNNTDFQLKTTRVFRDFSAWYHFLLVFDTTQSTASDRIKLYINGLQETTFSTSTYPTLNTDYGINQTAYAFRIGSEDGRRYLNGYLADIRFIDGQALTPSSFTEVSATTGQLIPKAYTGSFGTNGFKLTFSDNSATTATTLGKDYSGNSNNWTPNNVSVTTGTGRYIPYVSNTGTIYSGSIADMFDGSTSNLDTLRMYGGTWTLTPSPTITVSSSIRVMAFNDGSGRTNTLTANSTSVNVTDQTLSWRTITLPSYPATLTSLSATAGGSTGNDGICVSAIEIDGVILTDKAIVGLGNDSLVDTPTSYGTDTGAGGEVRGNYATLNPLNNAGASGTYSNGNLEITTGSSQYGAYVSTIATPTSGKWYAEAYITSGANTRFGFVKASYTPSSTEQLGNVAGTMAYRCDNGDFRVALTTKFTGGATCTSGDTVGLALDNDNGEVKIYKNGSLQGTATGIEAANWCFAGSDDNGAGTASHIWNFGQRPFAYTAPSGFKALCDTNLPAPVVAKGSSAMDVLTWTGNSASSRALTGLGFSPDFVWIKDRSNGYNHVLFDAVRGAGGSKVLFSNRTTAEGGGVGEEGTNYGAIASFDSSGFTVAPGAVNSVWVNQSSDAYVAWCWDAGTSTVTNTQGSITSSVRANQSAGFSIATYTGNNTANATFGHGLGVTPEFVVIKKRSSTGNWIVYHKGMTSSAYYMYLNATDAQTNQGGAVNTWGVSSTLITLKELFGDYNASGATYVAYCFAPVSGYSSFGSYNGNGSATDGPFVYTGFRPKWILIKRTNAVDDWPLMDTVRTPANPQDAQLYPNFGNAESNPVVSSRQWDALSNGFKIRGNNDAINNASGTYIYAAFAEAPFQYARAR